MISRYKHRCPGCKKLLFTRKMYCLGCSMLYPERSRTMLHDGQQKWLKGIKLQGVPPVEPHLVIAISDKRICLECGAVLTENTKHKCYTKSRASGYTASSIICAVCSERKPLGYFPIFIRRIRGHSMDEVKSNICSLCLDGKQLAERRA